MCLRVNETVFLLQAAQKAHDESRWQDFKNYIELLEEELKGICVSRDVDTDALTHSFY